MLSVIAYYFLVLSLSLNLLLTQFLIHFFHLLHYELLG